MLRDALSDLYQASGVEIVQKVGRRVHPLLQLFFINWNYVLKLIEALDVASFRKVGNIVNETVRPRITQRSFFL